MKSAINWINTKDATPQHWKPVFGVFDYGDDDPPMLYVVAFDGVDWWDDNNCKTSIPPYAWAHFPSVPPKPKK